ncbi:MAG: hypothetical protein IJ562_06660 [Prevotella sp.]|nr:hypothetical protein [Prevotella sp.]
MEERKIQQLIERFLNGETTNAEEQALYDYFDGEDIAESLKQYQEMFHWYANGMPAISRHKRTYVAAILAIAASLLLLVGVGLGYWHYQQQQEEYAIYEGSYIIRDGKKITDIRQILPELKAAERKVSEMMNPQNTNQEIPTI